MDLICGIVDFHKTPDISIAINMIKNCPSGEILIVSDEAYILCFYPFANISQENNVLYIPFEKRFFLTSDEKEYFYIFCGSSFVFSSCMETIKGYPLYTISHIPTGHIAEFSKSGFSLY